MARLIDADALDEKLKHTYRYFQIAGDIAEAPTVDPIHAAGGCYCGECEYYQDNNGGYPHPECRWDLDETPDADDFCSYGRRCEDRE